MLTPVLAPDGQGLSLVIELGEDPRHGIAVRDTQALGERLGLPKPLLTELILLVDQTERKVRRHRSPQARITVSATMANAVVEWSVSELRITKEESQAVYLGPLPAIKSRIGPAPTRDPVTSASGWGWLPRGLPQATVLSRPHPRETQSGDMALALRSGDKLRLAVADGLGHGVVAREAAQRAIQSLRTDVNLGLQESLLRAHEHLAATRGATLGLVDIDLTTQILSGTTVGNVRVVLFFGAGRSWSPCGTDAVLGHGRGGLHGRLEVRIEQHPFPAGGILCLFSDGLVNQLRLPWQRGDLDETAVQLFQTFSVATDDATLLLLG